MITYSKDTTDELWTLVGLAHAEERKLFGLGVEIDKYVEARVKQLLDVK